MARDTIVTPASGLIDFENDGVSGASIQIDTSDNLTISAEGTVSIAANILQANAISANTITGANRTTSGGYESTSSDLLRLNVSAWTTAPEHSVLYNGWKSTLGDYVTLKASGNSTSGHGIVAVADNGIYFGRSDAETGQTVPNNSGTAPLDTNWAYINSSGLNVSGNITLTGTVDGANVAEMNTKLSGIDNNATNTADPAITTNGSTPSLASGISAAEVRSLIGAGTSSLVLGTTSSTALAGNTFIPTVNNNTITLSAGNSGISMDADNSFTLNQGSNETITISHADTSSISNIDNSGGTVIQDLTFDGFGHVTAQNSINLDGRYYTESELQTFFKRGYISSQSATSLAVGWYTIAINPGDRASARFTLWDTSSGNHQTIHFYATHKFGTNESNDINVVSYSCFTGSDQPIERIRIKELSTYDGAVLQVYISDTTNSVSVALHDNVNSQGWVLKDWIPDATDPGGVSTASNSTNGTTSAYSSFTQSTLVNLKDTIGNGGVLTTGKMFAGGQTTQYQVLTTDDFTNSFTANRALISNGSGNVAASGVTTTELNILDGATVTTAELNKLDGFTGVAADLNYAKDLRATGVTSTEFNKLDGLTATTTELNYVDGVTSAIQTQLNGRVTTANTRLDQTSHSLVNFTSAGDYNKRSGYQTFMRGTSQNASVVGTPVAANYWYYNVMAKRDSAGGTAATLMNYDNGDFYVGLTPNSSTNPTWRRAYLDTDFTTNTRAPNSATTTANRSYLVQRSSTDNTQLIVNVPWTDNNTNNYASSLAFNTSTGVLTVNRQGLSALTQDLDNRYVQQAYDAVPAYSNNNYDTIRWNSAEAALELQSSSDTSMGAVFPAFRVDAGGTFNCSVQLRSSATSTGGVYIRVYEYDDELPAGKTHVSNSATNAVVQEDTREATMSATYENRNGVTSWTTHNFTYTPTSSAVWASIVVLNWAGLGTNSLYIRQPKVERLFSSAASNNTAVLRHPSGYIYANYFNTTPNDIANGAITKIVAESGGDGFMRHATAAAVRTFLNVADGAATGTVTSVGAGTGLSNSGTATDPVLNLALNELSNTTTMITSDKFVVVDGTASRKISASEVINDLSLVTGNVTGSLFADIISANTINANMIAANSIVANLINADTISANNITTGTLDAANVTISNLTADNISGDVSEHFNSFFETPLNRRYAFTGGGGEITTTPFSVPAPSGGVAKRLYISGWLGISKNTNDQKVIVFVEQKGFTVSSIGLGQLFDFSADSPEDNIRELIYSGDVLGQGAFPGGVISNDATFDSNGDNVDVWGYNYDSSTNKTTIWVDGGSGVPFVPNLTNDPHYWHAGPQSASTWVRVGETIGIGDFSTSSLDPYIVVPISFVLPAQSTAGQLRVGIVRAPGETVSGYAIRGWNCNFGWLR